MRDQTEQSAGVAVAFAGEGTAVFLLRQPDGSHRKEMKRLDSYVAFVEQSKDPLVVACKWVPAERMSYALLAQSSCEGVACVDRCVHPGCLCDPHTNTCR